MATGKMFVFDAGRSVPPRYIINFPTKQPWRSPSKLEYAKRNASGDGAGYLRTPCR